ncbi:hypothetical protein SAMN05421810_10673 [Amycolatopsis arida]|uniref:Uncharacterized protein n=1 Tax=Amycolatopsis arida TaxID=587909 RepID=A0A1I5XIH6_9PSEU|nr:hypothetical protein [Amycolatopsis arida]TDX97444.1 hypothetical protein CLV69_102548 [Amycolatopsis arida]SFQ31467.1 hypothetical protein SAMN05421810_10673 [Amycolatopsis arida]
MRTRDHHVIPVAPPADQEPTPEQRYRAARAAASAARDAKECAELLEALGLSADEGLRIPGPRPAAD